VRSITSEEIKRQPKLMGEDVQDVDQHLGAGLQAIGAVKDSSIISFVWISPHPPSLAAFRSAGFKTVSTFRSAKFFGKHWIQPTSSQKMPRFRVQRVISEKQSSPPLCD
jgi:hypothetical protein